MSEILANEVDGTVQLNGAQATTPAQGTVETWTFDAMSSALQAGAFRAKKTGGSSTDEIVLITPTSSTSASVTRGVDGTSTQSHADNEVLIPIGTRDGMLAWLGARILSSCFGRLTLTTGVPITTSDVTAATTLYFTPFRGNIVSLFDGHSWNARTFTELSISLSGLTASTNYDVFIYDNLGTLTLELVAWTNDTTRATALALQDGVYCKSGTLTNRYIGTIRTTGTTGQCEDSLLRRFVWNAYNSVRRNMKVTDTTDSWTYNSATYRPANNSTANRVQYVVGLSEEPIEASVFAAARTTSTIYGGVGIGVDSTSVNSAALYSENYIGITTAQDVMELGVYSGFPGVGFHFLQWVERARSANTMTFFGDGGGTALQSGLVAVVRG